MRSFRIPLLVTLMISLGLGLGLGWKLRRDRAAQLGVVTSSRKLRVLALTGALPAAILPGFRSSANIEVEIVEEPTPDAVMARLDSDPAFDVVTLMTAQLPVALQNSRIQPFLGVSLESVSRDFSDVPGAGPRAVPFLWGLLGFAYSPDHVDSLAGWSDVFDLDRETRIVLKPYSAETLRLARIGMPVPFAENALQDRVKRFGALYKHAARFLVDPSLAEPDGDVVELSFSEATIAAFKDMKFVLPAERGLLWILNLALTSGSKNEAEARAFASYVLEPATALSISEANHEASTNLGVEQSTLLPTQKPSSLRRIPLTDVAF